MAGGHLTSSDMQSDSQDEKIDLTAIKKSHVRLEEAPPRPKQSSSPSTVIYTQFN